MWKSSDVIISVLFVSEASHDQVAAANGEASTAAAETPAAEVHVTRRTGEVVRSFCKIRLFAQK